MYSRDSAEDLTACGATTQAEYLTSSLEPDDVEALLEGIRTIRLDGIADVDLRGRVEGLVAQLSRIVRHGSGLTDQYSDDVD